MAEGSSCSEREYEDDQSDLSPTPPVFGIKEIEGKISALPISDSTDQGIEWSSGTQSTRKKQKQKAQYGLQACHSSGSSTDSSALKKSLWNSNKYRVFASNFTKREMTELKIFYDKTPMSIEDFLAMIKENKNWETETADYIISTFKKMTVEQLGNFEVDLENICKTAKTESNQTKRDFFTSTTLRRISSQAIKIKQFFLKTITSGQLTDPMILSLLGDWKAAVTEFVKCSADVVLSVLCPQSPPPPSPSPDQTAAEKNTCQTIYHVLLAAFSRIFLLRPMPGSVRKRCGMFKKKMVTSEPDITFLQSMDKTNGFPVAVMMCEVKRDESDESKGKRRRPKDTYIEEIISSKTMGQIGMVLLSESSECVFRPCAVGITCFKSELMFLLMDISEEHFNAIVENEPLDGKRASIHYTKTYNFLKPKDRSEVLDIMFHLSAIQNFNFTNQFV